MKSQNLTYAEAALFLGIPTNTLYSMVAERRIPHIRLGRRFVRFSVPDLERWLREQAVPAQGAQAID